MGAGRLRGARRRGMLAGMLAVSLSAVAAPVSGSTEHFRYKRDLSSPAAGLVCAVLDPAIFAHAALSLDDLRVFVMPRDGGAAPRELPYVLTESGTRGAEREAAAVQRIERHGSGVRFDLAMPRRAYTDVELDLAGKDFAATAAVSAPGTPAGTLGTFAIFDLSVKGLPRSTVLHLQETAEPVLQVELRALPGSAPLSPGMVRGASVPPSREAQTLFTAAVSTTDVQQQGSLSVARLALPARVPIERVRVVLAPGFRGDLRRTVRVVSRPEGASGDERETLTGEIDRVHQVRAGVTLAAERMTVPATLGANLQAPAEVEVAIENGGEPPLPVRAIVLESRERRLCLVAPADAESVRVFYGDPGLKPPTDSAASVLGGGGSAKTAVLGPEVRNPAFVPRTEQRSLRKRHPRLLAVALLLAVCLLGVVVLRSERLRV